jgi:hypothetical protein
MRLCAVLLIALTTVSCAGQHLIRESYRVDGMMKQGGVT